MSYFTPHWVTGSACAWLAGSVKGLCSRKSSVAEGCRHALPSCSAAGGQCFENLWEPRRSATQMRASRSHSRISSMRAASGSVVVSLVVTCRRALPMCFAFSKGHTSGRSFEGLQASCRPASSFGLCGHATATHFSCGYFIFSFRLLPRREISSTRSGPRGSSFRRESYFTSFIICFTLIFRNPNKPLRLLPRGRVYGCR